MLLLSTYMTAKCSFNALSTRLHFGMLGLKNGKISLQEAFKIIKTKCLCVLFFIRSQNKSHNGAADESFFFFYICGSHNSINRAEADYR